MATLLSLLASRLGQLAIAFLLGLAVGGWLMWKWCHHERTFVSSYSVSAVPNGATLEVKAGLLGRKIRRVTVAQISAPGIDDPLGGASQANLEKLAGGTVRVESDHRLGLAGGIVGRCFGATGTDLALAQVSAGLATCETSAASDLKAAQRDAQKHARGLWASQKAPGSHWWHFSAANDQSHPEPVETGPEPANAMLPFDLGTLIQYAVIATVAVWLLWGFIGKPIVAKYAAASAVTTVVDTSQQIAAYVALTGIRHVAVVENDTKAVESCEYLRGVVTSWKPAAKPATN